MSAFVRLVSLANAAFWAYAAVEYAPHQPAPVRWISLVMFALSLLAAVVPSGSKRPDSARSGSFSSLPSAPVRPAPLLQNIQLPHDMSKYRTLAAQGKKIAAIKLLREDFPQLGLKGAKDVIESL